MDTIKLANKVIKDGIELLPDDAKGDFKAQAADIFIYEAINNACGAVNKDEEKKIHKCLVSFGELDAVEKQKDMDMIPNMASSFVGAKLVYNGDLVFNKLKAHHRCAFLLFFWRFIINKT